MSFSQIFADNALVRLLRGSTARADLLVSMAGVKLGERLVTIGLARPAVLSAVAAKVGLTGRACGVDPSADAVDRARRSAERAGVLVELAQADVHCPPYDPDSFDLAIVVPGGSVAGEAAVGRAVAGARAVVRDGGRCLIIDEMPHGVSSILDKRTGTSDARGEQLVRILGEHGCRAARVLAEREHLLFVEGVVKR